ncbi:hypothetical protein KY338_04500 [Candidatus Woesearchaeota archaeon]|nr:hypothetical protein [Candidatus Woesearchaeota archaeon]MBW3005760.1 hypothetical protein [Candidatus Woesearchaeota archaeon]
MKKIAIIILFIMSLLLCGCSEKAETTELLDWSKNIDIIDFISSLQSIVDANAHDYGSMQIKEFNVPYAVDEVCFASNKVLLKHGTQEVYPFDVNLLEVESDFCTTPTDGKIKLKIEGKGNYAQVSKA